MGVRSYVRGKDGATVYCARFLGPDGRELVRVVRVVKRTKKRQRKKLPDGSTVVETKEIEARREQHENARAAALHYAEQARVEIQNGTWKDPMESRPERDPLTFEKLVKRFLRDYRTRSGRIDYYDERAKAWLKHLSGPVRSISVADVDRFRRARLDEVSAGTVRKDLVSLSTLFEWAKRIELCEHNPADHRKVKRPPRTRPDPHPLTKGEELALLEAAPEWLEPIIEFAIETGVDRSEILALSWTRHVDRERREIHLARGKTGVGRAIPYRKNARLRLILARAQNAHLRLMLASAGRIRALDEDAVFLRSERRVKLQAAKTALRRAWKAAEITKPRPWKTLRATFASRRAEAGVDTPSIAALMGLTTSHVLEHYILPSGAHLTDAMSSTPRRKRERQRPHLRVVDGESA